MDLAVFWKEVFKDEYLIEVKSREPDGEIKRFCGSLSAVTGDALCRTRCSPFSEAPQLKTESYHGRPVMASEEIL